jgi:hypothetical protein
VLIRLPPPDPTATALIRPQLPRSGCCHLYRPATRGAPGATLSREVGATPPPPLPPPSVGGQGVAPSRSGRRCLYLVATLLGLPPPPRRSRPPRPRLPRHQRTIIYMWHSSVSTPVTAFAPSQRCNCGGMSVRRILPLTYSSSLTVCGAPAVTAEDVRVYLVGHRGYCDGGIVNILQNFIA